MRTMRSRKTSVTRSLQWAGMMATIVGFTAAASAVCRVSATAGGCSVNVDGKGEPEIVVENCQNSDAVCACRVELDSTGIVKTTGCGGCGACL